MHNSVSISTDQAACTGQEKQFTAHIAIYDSQEVNNNPTFSNNPSQGQVPEGMGSNTLGFDIPFMAKCGGDVGDNCEQNVPVDSNHHQCNCGSVKCNYEVPNSEYCIFYPKQNSPFTGACYTMPKCAYDKNSVECACFKESGVSDVSANTPCAVGKECYKDGECDNPGKEDEHKVASAETSPSDVCPSVVMSSSLLDDNSGCYSKSEKPQGSTLFTNDNPSAGCLDEKYCYITQCQDDHAVDYSATNWYCRDVEKCDGTDEGSGICIGAKHCCEKPKLANPSQKTCVAAGGNCAFSAKSGYKDLVFNEFFCTSGNCYFPNPSICGGIAYNGVCSKLPITGWSEVNVVGCEDGYNCYQS